MEKKDEFPERGSALGRFANSCVKLFRNLRGSDIAHLHLHHLMNTLTGICVESCIRELFLLSFLSMGVAFAC